jgi:hypothetical protein
MESTHVMPSDELKAGLLSLFWWIPAVLGVVVLLGELFQP